MIKTKTFKKDNQNRKYNNKFINYSKTGVKLKKKYKKRVLSAHHIYWFRAANRRLFNFIDTFKIKRKQDREKKRKIVKIARFRKPYTPKDRQEICKRTKVCLKAVHRISTINYYSNKILNLLMKNGEKKSIKNIYDKICIVFQHILKKKKLQINLFIQKLIRWLAYVLKISQPFNYRPPILRVVRVPKRFYYSLCNLYAGIKKKQVYILGNQKYLFDFLFEEIFNIFIKNYKDIESYHKVNKFNKETGISIVELKHEFLLEKLRRTGRGKQKLRDNANRTKKIKNSKKK